jgi:hypothetical protein
LLPPLGVELTPSQREDLASLYPERIVAELLPRETGCGKK